MSSEIFPVIFWQSGVPDLWLCTLKDGAYFPVGKTGPIVLPKDWRDALINSKNKDD